MPAAALFRSRSSVSPICMQLGSLCFSLLRSAGHGCSQQFHFLPAKWTHGPRRQFAEPDRTDRHSLQPLHFVTNAGEQSADFAVAAFVEDHLQNRRLLAATFDSYMLHMCVSFGKMNSSMELSEHFGLSVSGDLHVVYLFDAVPRMRKTVRQVAVIGY